MIRITALMDDKPSGRRGLTAQHGLSYLVEGEGYRFLFDCGQGAHTWENARNLGASLEHLEGVVLSHGHYDHAGGYRYLIEAGGGSKTLYTGKDFFEPKFSFDGVKYTDLSAGFDREFLASHSICHKEVSALMESFPGVYLIGGFPRKNEFERIPSRFHRLTPSGMMPDVFDDEICMALDVGGKLVMLVGCSHPGILNMAEHVRETLGLPICAIFGGAHLAEAEEERIRRTIVRLKEMGLEVFGLSHCSGEKTESILGEDPEIVSCHLGAGDCIFLG